MPRKSKRSYSSSNQLKSNGKWSRIPSTTEKISDTENSGVFNENDINVNLDANDVGFTINVLVDSVCCAFVNTTFFLINYH